MKLLPAISRPAMLPHVFHALSRISSSSKSQCLPSMSCVVRSSANPSNIPKLGHHLATADTRGGEYISLTVALIAFPRSRRDLTVLPPRLYMMLIISPLIALASSRVPRSHDFMSSLNGMSSFSMTSRSIVGASPAAESDASPQGWEVYSASHHRSTI